MKGRFRRTEAGKVKITSQRDAKASRRRPVRKQRRQTDSPPIPPALSGNSPGSSWSGRTGRPRKYRRQGMTAPGKGSVTGPDLTPPREN